MKVLMLNTFDEAAGADRAARRLQRGLRGAGIDSELLVHLRHGGGEDVLCPGSPLRRSLRRLKLYAGTLPVRLYPRRPVNNFTPTLLPDRLPARVAKRAPDLVHLHWLGAGFCRIETIARLARPLVWTLHDSWPFTGGCHVPGDCLKYYECCGACPVLGSSDEKDLSRRVWERKARAWRELPLTVVAPSRWMADCARASSLFRQLRIEVIPNGLDTAVFRPMDKAAARARLGLPPERPLVLFGAINALTDRNKGWHLLQPALERVAARRPDTAAVVFGAPVPPSTQGMPMETTFLGRLRDDASLVAAYSAADVFVAPSLQESFCQTALEAMACGTPVAAFAATGLLDIVDHLTCGYLAQPYESEDLARGILWLLDGKDRRMTLSAQARDKAVRGFAGETMAQRYAALYAELLCCAKAGRG